MPVIVTLPSALVVYVRAFGQFLPFGAQLTATDAPAGASLTRRRVTRVQRPRVMNELETIALSLPAASEPLQSWSMSSFGTSTAPGWTRELKSSQSTVAG